jgi:hypothetical protein
MAMQIKAAVVEEESATSEMKELPLASGNTQSKQVVARLA